MCGDNLTVGIVVLFDNLTVGIAVLFDNLMVGIVVFFDNLTVGIVVLFDNLTVGIVVLFDNLTPLNQTRLQFYKSQPLTLLHHGTLESRCRRLSTAPK